MPGDVVTLQLGHYAGCVGAHWWGLQVRDGTGTRPGLGAGLGGPGAELRRGGDREQVRDGTRFGDRRWDEDHGWDRRGSRPE